MGGDTGVVDIRVLGPLEVVTTRGPIRLAPLGRRLIALLAASAGTAMSVDRLTEALWDGQAPADARNRVQAAVYAVRRRLTAHGVGRPVLLTAGLGYTLAEGDVRLDAAEFAESVAKARAHVAAGEAEAGIAAFRSGLALWRGTPFEGVDVHSVQVEAARLEELRLSAVEGCAAAQLAAGRPAEVVAELTPLVASHPFREDLRAVLMLALYRCGRAADAIAVYRAGRDLARTDLGLEPGDALQGLLRAILARDAALAPAAPAAPNAPPRPTGLPPDRASFTGRVDDLGWLGDEADAGTNLLVISGPGGVGKTALAVRWAHAAHERFPDGRLYLNLQGFDRAEPLSPLAAIDALLHLLDRPRGRPMVDLAVASSALRAALAGRRLLLVLDNAFCAEQVRPLLPGEPRCVTVVTSRDRMSGLIALDGARRRELGPLAPAESLELFARLVGGDRVAAEPEAAAEALAYCGHLPLAIGIVAANLLDDPGLSIAAHRDALGAGARLDVLSVPGDTDAAVRSALWLSYRRLAPPQQRAVRLFGMAMLTHLTEGSVSAALRQPPAAAARLLRSLTQANLLEAPSGGRYPAHDFIRLYAKELSHDHDGADTRESALRRLIEHYAELAAGADAVLRSTRGHRLFADQPSAAAWFDHEYTNLATLLAEAAQRDWRSDVIALATPTRGYLRRMYRLAEWRRVFELGLAAATADGDHEASGQMHEGLADMHFQSRQWTEARDAWIRAAAAFRKAGNEYRWALCHDNMGIAALELGDAAAAERYHREALGTAAFGARLRDTAATHIHLGIVYGSTQRWAESRSELERALSLATEAGNHELVCFAQHNLAELFQHTGDVAAARARALAEVELAERVRLPLRAAEGHNLLANLLATPDPEAAAAHRRAALSIYDSLRHPKAAAMRG